MPTLYTETQRAALAAAYASGTLRVSYDGKSVEYRTLSEMRRVLDDMNKQLDGVKRRRIYRARTSGDRGL